MKVLLLVLFFNLVISDFHCNHIRRNDTIYRATLSGLLDNTKKERNEKFSIILNKGNGLRNNEKASNAFSLAADIWESFLRGTLPDTPIRINVDMQRLPYGVLGNTDSINIISEYGPPHGIIPYPISNITGFNFPTLNSISFDTGRRATFRGYLLFTKANLKVLGFNNLDSNFGESDGQLIFSSDFDFDYNIYDGIDRRKTDFLSVVLHEMGHLLGFVSGLDYIEDGYSEYVPSLLDLFRFDSLRPNFLIDRRVADPRITTHLFIHPLLYQDVIPRRFSRGALTGDGYQASHWGADELYGPYVGIMDPSLPKGKALVHTRNDLYAFQGIGYIPCVHITPRIMYVYSISGDYVILVAHLAVGSEIKCKMGSDLSNAGMDPSTGYITCRILNNNRTVSLTNNGIDFSNIINF
jgi:hypothetical protein